MDRETFEAAALRHGWTVAAEEGGADVEYHLSSEGSAPGRTWTVSGHLPVVQVEAVDGDDAEAVVALFADVDRWRDDYVRSVPKDHPEKERLAAYQELVDGGMDPQQAEWQVWPDSRGEVPIVLQPGNVTDVPGGETVVPSAEPGAVQ